MCQILCCFRKKKSSSDTTRTVPVAQPRAHHAAVRTTRSALPRPPGTLTRSPSSGGASASYLTGPRTHPRADITGAGAYPRETVTIDSEVEIFPLDKLPVNISEYVLSYLDNDHLNRIAVCSTSWRNLARGELIVNWCKLHPMARRLSGQRPERFNPHRETLLSPSDPAKVFHRLHSREKERTWIHKVTAAAARLHEAAFAAKHSGISSRLSHQLYQLRYSVSHLVFRGCDENPDYVFARGFQTGFKNFNPESRGYERDHLKPLIEETGSSGFSTMDFGGAPRSVISTSYSYGFAKRSYASRHGDWVYICVPHRGFNLSSGQSLEMAELGIPNRLILCAMRFNTSRKTPSDVIFNNRFYDQEFIRCLRAGFKHEFPRGHIAGVHDA